MQNLLSALNSLFDFLFSQITQFANFITSTTLGQIVLGVAILSIISSIVLKFIKK